MKILKLIKRFIKVFNYNYRADGLVITLEYIKILKKDNKPCSFEKLVEIMERDLEIAMNSGIYWGC